MNSHCSLLSPPRSVSYPELPWPHTERAACHPNPSILIRVPCRLDLKGSIRGRDGECSEGSSDRMRYLGSRHGHSHAARWRRTCMPKDHAWGRWDLVESVPQRRRRARSSLPFFFFSALGLATRFEVGALGMVMVFLGRGLIQFKVSLLRDSEAEQAT